MVDIAHPAHNPFDVPRPRRNNGVTVAIVLSLVCPRPDRLLPVAVEVQAHYQKYSDEKTERAADQAAAAAAAAAATAAAAEEPAAAAAGSAAAAGRAAPEHPGPAAAVHQAGGDAQAGAGPAGRGRRPRRRRRVPTVITNPDWLRRPSGEDLAQYYPERAQRLGVAARATLQLHGDGPGNLDRVLGGIRRSSRSGFRHRGAEDDRAVQDAAR